MMRVAVSAGEPRPRGNAVIAVALSYRLALPEIRAVE